MTITSITLHRQGISEVTRELSFKAGNSSTSIGVKRKNMDDFLNSVLITVTNQAMIHWINFGSNESTENFSVNLKGSNVLLNVIKESIGVSVLITIPKDNDTITGIVMGIQVIEFGKDNNGNIKKETFLVLNTRNGMKKTNIVGIGAISFRNSKFESLVKDSIKKHAMNEDDIRNVTIESSGSKEYGIKITYKQPTAKWKTSYRLTMDNKENNKVILSLWAVIDNDFDDIIKNVRLTLKSGFPITFKTPIFDIIRKERRVVALTDDDGDIKKDPVFERATIKRKKFVVRRREKKGMVPVALTQSEEDEKDDDTFEDIQFESSVTQKGTFVTYKLDKPVTIGIGKSITYPVFAKKLSAEKLYIYNEGINGVYPMESIKIKNDSDTLMVSGSGTVYDKNGNYQSALILNTLVVGDSQIIPTKLDPRIRITNKSDRKTKDFHQVKITAGVVRQSRWSEKITTYIINSQLDTNIIIEHERKDRSFKLFNMIKPIGETKNFYRFSVSVKKGETKEFKVNERQLFFSNVGITRFNLAMIDMWFSSNLINETLQEKLKELMTILLSMRQLERDIKELKSDKKELIDDRIDIRKDISILNDSKGDLEFRNELITRLKKTSIDMSIKDKKVKEKRKEINEKKTIFQNKLKNL